MVFSKTFPRQIPGSNYPVWEEVYLTDEEEQDLEAQCRKENYLILDECIKDAKALAIKNSINSDENVSALAIALFEKRSSHVIFWKESKAKEKFDQKIK